MDITSWWATIRIYEKWIQCVLAVILAFLLGYHTASITIPASSSHQIVFEDRQCSACTSSGGSPEDLARLREEGRGGSAVAGVISASADSAEKLFVASINSDLFHHHTCSSAKRINEENQIWFASADEARASGYEPSSCAKEKGF